MKSLLCKIVLLLPTVFVPFATAQRVFRDCPECPEMVVIPPGSFMMGSPAADPFKNDAYRDQERERPQHRVQIKSFAIGKYELTQEEYYSVMGFNPSTEKGRTLPVHDISWLNAKEYISKLNQKTGQKYRLPTEAEWEYSARAGSTTDWGHGNDSSKLGKYAWYYFTAGAVNVHPVGKKLPNAFGLHDMHGNVAEWVEDCWHHSYDERPLWDRVAPRDGSAWIDGPNFKSPSNNKVIGCGDDGRVIRGGNSTLEAEMRSASRNSMNYYLGSYSVGFRVVRNIP